MRVLVTVSPQMYCQAIALSIQSARPGIEVRIAPPEAAEEQLRLFQPDLLLYNDTAPISQEALEGIPARVEVLYSDSTDARHVDRRLTKNGGRGGKPRGPALA